MSENGSKKPSVRESILQQPTEDPFAVVEGLIVQAQSALNAARTILAQQRQLRSGQPQTETQPEQKPCPHPPKARIRVDTMGDEGVEYMCGDCGENLGTLR